MRVGDLVPAGECGAIRLMLGRAVEEMETDAIQNWSRAIYALNMPASDIFALAQNGGADDG